MASVNTNWKWCALFSQTGSEINNISNNLGKLPDCIVTNKSVEEIETINLDLLNKAFDRIIFVPKKPTVEEYRKAIPAGSVVTLHGYLRIIPREVCEEFQIYNLHPANLLIHPQYKGFNPQERAFHDKKTVSGNTIHKVVEEVDAGEILSSSIVPINHCKSTNEVIKTLHTNATELWTTFLSHYSF